MSYTRVRKQLLEQVRQSMPEYSARLAWSRQEIEQHQVTQLGLLMQHAVQHSTYYQQRCQAINPRDVRAADLALIPPSTKQDIMEHWDEIVCVPDLTRALAEQRLQAAHVQPNYNPFYQDKYYLTATGGSSGQRGLFIWDLDYFTTVACVTFRYQFQDDLRQSNLQPTKIAVLTAPTLIHASTPLFSINVDPQAEVRCYGADSALKTLCHELEAWQPMQLIGYSSVITELAYQTLEGHAAIKPRRVSTNSEPLDDQARAIIWQAWGVEVNNMWGSVEMGLAGVESDAHCGLMLSEDVLIVEPVDADLKPVANPEDARKLIITNLYNRSLPLIRYVVDDAVVIKTTAESSYRVVTTIAGRADDWFTYDDRVRIHPIVFRHVLGQYAAISEYQVEQTVDGAIVRIVADEVINRQALTSKINEALINAGLSAPKIELYQLDALARHTETGKLKRFIALN